MGLYTFILEYRGGTYISQFEACNPTTALETWLDKHDHSVVAKLKPKHVAKIREWCKEVGFVAITGTTNVGCISFRIKRHMSLLNFVLTSIQTENR